MWCRMTMCATEKRTNRPATLAGLKCHGNPKPVLGQMRWPLLVFMAMALFWLYPEPAGAATIQVAPGESIQDAIDGADNLDTIQLMAGTHALSTGLEILNKDLTLTGDGTAGASVVEGNGNRVFKISNAVVSMENLTITGGDTASEWGAGIYQTRGRLTLTNCIVTQNGSDTNVSGGGVAVSAGELILAGCTISENRSLYAPGIYCEDSGVTIEDSTIEGNVGTEIDPAGDIEAGCDASLWIGMGGGLGALFSEVTIHDTIIRNNLASIGGAVGALISTVEILDTAVTGNGSFCEGGGGVFDGSSVTITSTEATGNETKSINYGVGGAFLAVSGGSLDITSSTISGNTSAIDGGGLYFSQTIGSLTGSTVAGNKAGVSESAWGGGIVIDEISRVTITDSTLSGNTATATGGGIWMFGADSGFHSTALDRGMTSRTLGGKADTESDQPASLITGSNLIMANSTVSGNSAGEDGGGLAITNGAYINFCTITNNTADYGGGMFSDCFSKVYLGSTIVAGNTAISGGPDWYSAGEYGSRGGNLVGDNTDSGLTASTFTAGLPDPNPDGDYVGAPASRINPQLGVLADNGGPTQTHALLLGAGPAVDRARSAIDQDQRGYSRPYPNGGVGDIGAFEYYGISDLNLTKVVNNQTPLEGDPVTYTLTVANTGPDQGSGIAVRDILPAGLAYVSDDSGGGYDAGTGVWTIGDLAVAGTATLNMSAQVTQAGVITNTAVAGASTTDPTPATGSATITAVHPQGAVLTLSKTVDNQAPFVGNQIVYTLTVSNLGPDPAENVRVSDVLPAGLTYMSDDSGGAYDTSTGLWTVGNLDASGLGQITITAGVAQTGMITNLATAFCDTSGTIPVSSSVNIAAVQSKKGGGGGSGCFIQSLR